MAKVATRERVDVGVGEGVKEISELTQTVDELDVA